MAMQLIESLTTDFDPTKYHDTYRERVLDLIERKAEGEEITIEAAPEEPAKVPDLMAALEASLAATKKKPAAKTKTPTAKKDGQPAKRAATRKKREKAKT
jgi:DNA end-binding protein Ku